MDEKEPDYKQLYEEELKQHNTTRAQLNFIVQVLGQLPDQFDTIGKGVSALQNQMFNNATGLRNILKTYNDKQNANAQT